VRNVRNANLKPCKAFIKPLSRVIHPDLRKKALTTPRTKIKTNKSL
jgi:hypothetical protein